VTDDKSLRVCSVVNVPNVEVTVPVCRLLGLNLISHPTDGQRDVKDTL
jgi:hypothetical protein